MSQEGVFILSPFLCKTAKIETLFQHYFMQTSLARKHTSSKTEMINHTNEPMCPSQNPPILYKKNPYRDPIHGFHIFGAF